MKETVHLGDVILDAEGFYQEPWPVTGEQTDADARGEITDLSVRDGAGQDITDLLSATAKERIREKVLEQMEEVLL